ncbi:membrane hypothetical protein [Gammaproteobacteria bacterium]
MNTPILHPKLQPQARLLKILQLLSISLMVLTAVITLALIFIGNLMPEGLQDAQSRLTQWVGLLVLLQILIIAGIAWFMRRFVKRQRDRLTQASRLLSDASGEAMTMVCDGLSVKNGTLIRLFFGNASQEYRCAVLFQRPGRSFRQTVPVTGFSKPPSPGGLVVLESHQDIWMGEYMDHAEAQRQSTQMARLMGGVATLVMLVLAMTTGHQGWTWWQVEAAAETARASVAWPTTAGRIKTVAVVPSNLPHPGRTPGATVPGYSLQVGFDYQVSGQSHHGEMLRYCNPPATDPVLVNTKAATLQAGASVTVSYDPLDSSRGVLEPGPGPECEAWLATLRESTVISMVFMTLVLLVLVATGMRMRQGLRAFGTRPKLPGSRWD